MANSLSFSQRRILRFLTLACFFHFSGLNNGFAFFVVSPGQMAPINFAPIAIRSLAVAVNPFSWKRALGRQTLARSLFSSRQVLEISSRRTLQVTFPRLLDHS